MIRLILWTPLGAIAAHLCEEFLWPGGFASWYRHYPPGHQYAVSARFLLGVNAVFVCLAALVGLLGPTPRAWALWLTVAAIAGINGVYHIQATVRTRQYSPGVVTGSILYVPLLMVGAPELLRAGLVSAATALQAGLVAVAYQLWSSWRHRRAVIPQS